LAGADDDQEDADAFRRLRRREGLLDPGWSSAGNAHDPAVRRAASNL
jgi:hypothetical protein